MDTWLKKECVDIGESLFDVYHGWDDFYDALFQMSRDWDEGESAPLGWRINHVIDTGRMLGESITNNPHLSGARKDAMKNTIESILHEVPPKTWPTTEGITRGMIKLQSDLQYGLMERVVECQCGKPGGKS